MMVMIKNTKDSDSSIIQQCHF